MRKMSRKGTWKIRSLVSLFALAVAAWSCVPAQADTLLNVSIGTSTAKTSLAGPAGGSGTTWNQFQYSGQQWQDVSGSSLKDSAGATTSVGFAFGNQWNAFDSWGSPSLQLLVSGANPFGRQTGKITGLTPGTAYNIYIASYHGSLENNGSFSTTSTTSNGQTQSLDSTATPNGSTWVQGQNYVVFMAAVADASGNISLSWTPINYLAMMGFQIVRPGPAPTCTIHW